MEITPVIGLERVIIAGRPLKALAAPLVSGVDVLRVTSVRTTPLPWTTAPLPFDLGAGYPQAVNPYAWSRCATYLATLTASEGMSCRIVDAFDLMYDAILPFTEDGFFLYRFNKQIAQGAELTAAPWKSALGNAYVIIGATEAWRVTQDCRWLTLAQDHAARLMLQATDGDLVNLDAGTWLWFQEYPAQIRAGVSVRPCVLNGHVGTLFALYHYMSVVGSDLLINMHVRAAAATAATYYQRTRNPGAIMDYWLYDKTPDYGPLRAINFVTALGQMTGNPSFEWLRDAFMTDVPVTK